MATIDQFLMNLPENIQNVNVSKDLIISHLHNEGHLSDEVAKDYLNNYHMLIIKGSWINRIWKRFKSFGKEDAYRYELAKFVNGDTNPVIELPHKGEEDEC